MLFHRLLLIDLLNAGSVADVPDNKMSTQSLAKVYGPTLVGYSTADLEPGALLTETRQQQTVSTASLSLTHSLTLTRSLTHSLKIVL